MPRSDNEEVFIVEAIVDHQSREELLAKGSEWSYDEAAIRASRCAWAFRVRWEGYDEQDDSWQTYECFGGDKSLPNAYMKLLGMGKVPAAPTKRGQRAGKAAGGESSREKDDDPIVLSSYSEDEMEKRRDRRAAAALHEIVVDDGSKGELKKKPKPSPLTALKWSAPKQKPTEKDRSPTPDLFTDSSRSPSPDSIRRPAYLEKMRKRLEEESTKKIGKKPVRLKKVVEKKKPSPSSPIRQRAPRAAKKPADLVDLLSDDSNAGGRKDDDQRQEEERRALYQDVSDASSAVFETPWAKGVKVYRSRAARDAMRKERGRPEGAKRVIVSSDEEKDVDEIVEIKKAKPSVAEGEERFTQFASKKRRREEEALKASKRKEEKTTEIKKKNRRSFIDSDESGGEMEEKKQRKSSPEAESATKKKKSKKAERSAEESDSDVFLVSERQGGKAKESRAAKSARAPTKKSAGKKETAAAPGEEVNLCSSSENEEEDADCISLSSNEEEESEGEEWQLDSIINHDDVRKVERAPGAKAYKGSSLAWTTIDRSGCSYIFRATYTRGERAGGCEVRQEWRTLEQIESRAALNKYCATNNHVVRLPRGYEAMMTKAAAEEKKKKKKDDLYGSGSD